MASGRSITVQDVRHQERLVDAASVDEANLAADIEQVERQMDELWRWTTSAKKRLGKAQELARRERAALNNMIERYHAQREK